ncbi:hypothetical protein [Saccharibacillus sacchari]|uniref:Uncharacterized protein n=1 Tax=Saccharibacillus sacchari TaxID=456493 RepID=A0ACC6PFW1_9BACL
MSIKKNMLYGSLVLMFLSLLVIYPKLSLADTFSDDFAENSKYTEISERMREDGASEEDIQNVITKLKKGEVLDSEKPVSSNKTISPFSLQETNEVQPELAATLDNPVAVQRFPDGSYKKVGIELEKSEISVMSNTTSLYFNVYGTSPTARASYNTSAVIDTHLGASYITGVSGINIIAYGGNFLNEKLSIIRATEIRSKSIPAIAELYFKETNFVGTNASRRLTVEIGDHIADRYGIKVKYDDPNAATAGYK